MADYGKAAFDVAQKNTSQISNLSNDVKRTDFIRRGKVKLPPSVKKTLPFELYRDYDLLVKHTFNISSKIQGTSVYVNSDTGNDTKDGLSEANAVKTLEKAMTIANAQASNDIVIRILSRVLSRNDMANIIGVSYALTKNISIVAQNEFNEAYLSSAERYTDLAWTADGTAYKANRTVTTEVVDISNKDYRGIPKRLKKVNSVAEVQAEKGTWYTDGTTVWVRRLDDSAPSKELLLLLKLAGFNWNASGKKVVFQNIKFLFANSLADSFKITGDASTTLINDRCCFAYADNGNGLACINVGEVYSFNCTAAYNRRDGFNYHGNNVANPYEFVFEYNCYGYENGWGLEGNNNATTAHDGLTIVRVGSVGYDCDGPILADVSGCTVVCIDCDMHDSLRGTSITKAAYYFSSSGGFNLGDVYLINCGGGGVDTYSVAGDNTQKIYVKNFKGNNIHPNISLMLSV